MIVWEPSSSRNPWAANPSLWVSAVLLWPCCWPERSRKKLKQRIAHDRPPPNRPTGALEANSVAVGDFNHDGKLDLAVAHNCADDTCQSGGVSILLGNGDGTFQQPVVYPTNGAYSLSIAVGDVNGDGVPDLVVANQCSDSSCTEGSVSILLGNGDGTFQSAVTTGTPGQENFAVAAADLNHDGKAEVIVLGEVQDPSTGDPISESVFAANATGALTQIGQASTAGGYSYGYGESLAVGDVNGDGNPDIVITTACANISCNDAPPGYNYAGDGGGGIAVLLGNGDGTFGGAIFTIFRMRISSRLLWPM